MPTQKLTEKSIRAMPAPDPSGDQVLYWDDDLKGFGVLCSGCTNAKTYVVQRGLGNGRRRRITIGACNVLTLAVARGKAEQVLSEFYAGRDPKAGRKEKITLHEALEDYLAANKKLSAASRKNYRLYVEKHLTTWRDVPLKMITPEMVEARHRKIQKEVADEHKNGHATANQAMITLRILYNSAATATPLPPNPVGRLKRQWYAVPRRTTLVKADELPQFYKAVTELRNTAHRDFLLLVLFTGMRKEEAASLQWDDIDFAAKVIRVPATRTKTGTKLDLPMSDFVHALLVARRTTGREKYIFSADSKTGHLMEPRQSLDSIFKATGIEVTTHDLRRTFLTVAESCDISPLALKALVNHSIGGGVTEGYIVMTNERLRAPAQRVADRLQELCGITAVADEKVKKLHVGGLRP